MVINILIVDDEKVQRIYMSKLIQNNMQNIKIDFATDGNEAIEKCINFNKYDIILMDLTMPDCDGFTAAQTIRLLNEDVMIYPVTAFGEDVELKQKCIDSKMNGYYTKPLKKENLYEILSKFNISF